eukprot:gnl/MRDRNA2_/MRDRNA2_125527_c0_seq1.p1 gnl/MRDRNA2_/MRDRNA2_125527_c0~~gnl/MRDRNA2_/MRDRNA2_125527_c0_seq1.p1  ORF type:complete len:201 (-),score=51.37 gnl/MRDRNA2_/MRDRNA2_125527_c0_seq1:97-699(-)
MAPGGLIKTFIIVAAPCILALIVQLTTSRRTTGKDSSNKLHRESSIEESVAKQRLDQVSTIKAANATATMGCKPWTQQCCCTDIKNVGKEESLLVPEGCRCEPQRGTAGCVNGTKVILAESTKTLKDIIKKNQESFFGIIKNEFKEPHGKTLKANSTRFDQVCMGKNFVAEAEQKRVAEEKRKKAEERERHFNKYKNVIG